jgi:hypothetical protein
MPMAAVARIEEGDVSLNPGDAHDHETILAAALAASSLGAITLPQRLEPR